MNIIKLIGKRNESSLLPHCPSTQTVGNGCCFVYILGKYSSCQSISCVICPVNNLIHVAEFYYLLYWTENLKPRKNKN